MSEKGAESGEGALRTDFLVFPGQIGKILGRKGADVGQLFRKK